MKGYSEDSTGVKIQFITRMLLNCLEVDKVCLDTVVQNVAVEFYVYFISCKLNILDSYLLDNLLKGLIGSF